MPEKRATRSFRHPHHLHLRQDIAVSSTEATKYRLPKIVISTNIPRQLKQKTVLFFVQLTHSVKPLQNY